MSSTIQREHNAMVKTKKNLKVLLEMRPALDGFAGIPQECRLLFRGLTMVDSVEVEGMIQTSQRRLSSGTPGNARLSRKLSSAKKLNRYSRVIVSMAEKPYLTAIDAAADYISKKASSTSLSLRCLVGAGRIKLTRFESQHFGDFVWRSMFAKTLPASDYQNVTAINHRVCSVPWHLMHMAGLNSLMTRSVPRYVELNTDGFDIFVTQTPYPATVSRKTKMVVRYHDAIPVMMPHTIPDKSLHQATHFYALMSNVKSGAYFACVSEATRQDLIRMFPEAAPRSVTIHNMVSHHYAPAEAAPHKVPDIVRSRLYEGVKLLPEFLSLREKENFYKRHLHGQSLRYLLIVSTIEPRKNHTRLLAAWESIKAAVDPDLKLVIVGTLGWDYTQLVTSFRSWIDRGDLFMLNAVPAPDLRILYRNAAATVCPSLGEGFDFSGVESMRSGGVVIASDIPVHREVYDDAALYFDPYSTASLVKQLQAMLYSDTAQLTQDALRERGIELSERYLPEHILPRWDAFLTKINAAQAQDLTQDARAIHASLSI